MRGLPIIIRALLGLFAVGGNLLGPCAAVSQGSFALQHSLFNPGTNIQGGGRQGLRVALEGNLAVTGAPLDGSSEFGSGKVKVYNATTGVLLHTLSNPSRSESSFFGWSIAISGTRLVVGDPKESSAGELGRVQP